MFVQIGSFAQNRPARAPRVTAETQREIAAQSLRQSIKSYIGISAEIRVHDAGGIPRSEGKAKRIIDRC